MRKKYTLLGIVTFLLLYPVISAYLAQDRILEENIQLNRVEDTIVSYQISIWLTWVVLIFIAIFYKWTTEKNLFFFFTYAFLLVAFGLFGYFIQEMVTEFSLPPNFKDTYSLGVFTAIQHFAVAALLTAFLQGAVWWFTRKWHRR